MLRFFDEYQFFACEVSFEGEAGYILVQMLDGEKVGDSFISACDFDGFCKKTGIVPEMRGTEILAW